MDSRTRILDRVRESTRGLDSLVSGPSNVPLEKYIDRVSVDALSDSLSLEPDEWKSDDLERILIIRDGLYEIRQNLRDTGDDAEHSVDQLLSAMDRLYADLERALRVLGTTSLVAAQSDLAALHRGPQLESARVRQVAESLTQQANEVLVQSHITQRNIEINLIKIENSHVDIFRNARLSVQRFSASVFAIKLSLEQSVIFQGVFRFLNENADRIVAELREFLTSIKNTYSNAVEMAADISKLAEAGGRFTRQISNFIGRIFADPETKEERTVKFKVQTQQQGDTVLCGARAGKSLVLLGGRRGGLWAADTATSRIVELRRAGPADILSMATLGNDRVALGTDEGLDVITAIGGDQKRQQASYREKVVTVAATTWGGLGSGIITGSREGHVRRWSSGGGLSKYTEGFTERDLTKKLGRSMQQILPYKDDIIAASGADIFVMNSLLEIKRRIPIQFQATNMAFFDPETLVVCGEGNLAHVNLDSGAYTRVISSSPTVNYTTVAKLNDQIFCVGTKEGRLTAIEFLSGAEVGSIELDMHIRGIVPGPQRILAYGGPWESARGRAIAFITWNQVLDQAASS